MTTPNKRLLRFGIMFWAGMTLGAVANNKMHMAILSACIVIVLELASIWSDP